MGESKLKRLKQEEMLLSCSGVQTMAGRIQMRWATESAATPTGQLAYFIEFLNLTGLWSRWLEDCPLSYTSPNTPGKADVLGTWMLSVLAGHRRYSHVTTIRCDGVNPGLLGMNKVVSEDALRNALKRIPEAEGCAWLEGHLSASVAALLDAPWIFDTDTTIKVLYGHQEGAIVSYNPKKPGRPSHSYHTYLMAGTRERPRIVRTLWDTYLYVAMFLPMAWYYFAGGIRALFGVYGDFHRTPKGKDEHRSIMLRINSVLLAGELFTFSYSLLAVLVAWQEGNYFFIPLNLTVCVGFGMVLFWSWQERRARGDE